MQSRKKIRPLVPSGGPYQPIYNTPEHAMDLLIQRIKHARAMDRFSNVRTFRLLPRLLAS